MFISLRSIVKFRPLCSVCHPLEEQVVPCQTSFKGRDRLIRSFIEIRNRDLAIIVLKEKCSRGQTMNGTSRRGVF